MAENDSETTASEPEAPKAKLGLMQILMIVGIVVVTEIGVLFAWEMMRPPPQPLDPTAEAEEAAAEEEAVDVADLDPANYLPLDPALVVNLQGEGNAHFLQTTIQLIEKHNLRNAVVRLLLRMSPESEAQFNENAVREALRRSAAFHIASIRKEVDHPERTRLGTSPEGLTPEQLLDRYLLSREIPPERRAELIELASEIFDEVSGRDV